MSAPGQPSDRSARLRVVFLPPIAWLPQRRDYRADEAPDAAILERVLDEEGISASILDPTGRPWNPFPQAHPLLRGIDPLRALRVMLFRRDLDAVICGFEGPALVFALLRRSLRFRPQLLMWDLGLTQGWRLRDRMQDLIIPRLDAVLVLGSNQAGEVARRWPVHPRVDCIGHSIDTRFWRPPAQNSDLSIDVLSVGDDPHRDYSLLLQIAPQLEGKVVIRSDRTLPLDPARHAHVQQIRDRLSFVALRDLYASAKIVVIPLHERQHAGGISTFLEAAAMGCPTVVSDSPGLRDWLRHEENCLMVRCGDAAGFADAITRLAGDAKLRADLGRNARVFATDRCDTEIFARNLAARLRQAIADGRRAPASRPVSAA
jgi:glycosyltransferase involved in cell wall biosynthesis